MGTPVLLESCSRRSALVAHVEDLLDLGSAHCCFLCSAWSVLILLHIEVSVPHVTADPAAMLQLIRHAPKLHKESSSSPRTEAPLSVSCHVVLYSG